MSTDKVTIVVPAFNSELFLADALISITHQTYNNWECIVVNDGSTDNTRSLVEQFLKTDERFKLINIQNSGVSKARNLAIRNAQGKYIFPLDSDDKITSDCIEKCILEFFKNPSIKLVYPNGSLFGEENGSWELPDFDYKIMLKYNMIHNSSMYLKADFEKVGGYRENMILGLEDWDFYIALLYGTKKEQIVKISECLFNYRVGLSGRRLTVVSGGNQSEMLDLMVYNNYSIYQEYFPDIFHRIHDYGYDKIMLNKPIIKILAQFYNKAHQVRKLFSNH